jgi:addiction module HigA family antidote
MSSNRYRPDRVSPPGETLQEVLDKRQMSQADLAARTGRPRKTINEIIKGKTAITPETALQFERVLGVPASFWNNLERNYREHLARQGEEEALEGSAWWLERIPYRELIRRGYIEERASKVGLVRAVLNFFGVASPAEWETVFAVPQRGYRRSAAFTSETGALAAWLRIGELEAQGIECRPFDRERFEAALREARALTVQASEKYLRRLKEICASAGVAVVYVPELSGCRAYGATRWLSPTKALIQLSLRGQRNDFFWFTFFHEAAHLLFHGKRLTFVEGKPDKDTGAEYDGESDEEAQADRYAADVLIPPGSLEPFRTKRGIVSAEQVLWKAKELGIAPGILVGRLQYEGWLKRSHLNSLRVKVKLDN